MIVNSEKSQMSALILAWFFGWLGIHRFYVGRIKTGFLYLFTLGLFGFGQVFDIILILFGWFSDNEGKFLKSKRKNKNKTKVKIHR